VLRKLSRRLTYANVMSTIAVVVAVGTGGAYAANTIRSSDIVDDEIGSADVKDNSINTFDVHSFLGVDIVDGTIESADLAPTARGARAYGRVSSSGVLSRGKNVASVNRPFAGGGTYCITLGGGIDPATAVLIATPDFLDDSTTTFTDNASHVEWESSGSGCPQGTLGVRTFTYNGDGIDDDDGGGNSTGDDLVAADMAFAFVVP
jgi:hypothetical protein